MTPEWQGHLKAFNIYKVVNKGTAQEKRVADYSQVWDAGEVLRDVDPDDRSVLFFSSLNLYPLPKQTKT